MDMSPVRQVCPKPPCGARGKDMADRKQVRRQRQGRDRPGLHQVLQGSREQRKMEGTGCEVIRGAPTTPAVKEQVKG